MQLSLVISRIEARVPGLSGRAFGATSLADIDKSGPLRDRQVYVLPISEAASPGSIGPGAVRQRIDTQFGVVVVVRNVSDPRGEAAHDGGLYEIRGQLLDAICGWEPAAGYDTCEYSGGQLLKFNAGAIFWIYKFSTWHTYEKL